MEDLLIELETSIINLKKLNDSILYSIDHRIVEKLEKERSDCVTIIDHQCKNIKPKLTNGIINNRSKFIDLIKKYIIIQENYKNTRKSLFETQILMYNPNLTKIEIDNIVLTQSYTQFINNSRSTQKLCLANEAYNYVHDRHKSIMKLEKDIEENKELFIVMYALTELQGETVDRIAEKTHDAKTNCHSANIELTEAYKIKKNKWF